MKISKKKKMIIWIIVAAIVCPLIVTVIIIFPRFGKLPSGERLARIQRSEHYRDGIFVNVEPTIQLTPESGGRSRIFLDFFWGDKKGIVPDVPIPSVKTDLKELTNEEEALVWFGHSSYFIRRDGINILVDPVFSGYSSPVSFFSKAFEGTDVYTAEDMPAIDYLIITHDHYDHLDYKTIRALKNKVGRVITGLGTGSHLEYWGYSADRITEMEWGETIRFSDLLTVHGITSRHFSGRGFKPNRTMWMAFALEFPNYKIYIGGDGGYGKHFSEAGEKFGPFDLAILEDGQYNMNWRYIHTMPEQTVQAAQDLSAAVLLPVHHSKFALARHNWHDPLDRIAVAGKTANLALVLPRIGEPVSLRSPEIGRVHWWESIE